MAQHTYRHRAAEILGFVDGSAGAPMKLPRIVRQIGKRVVKATPILRRHILSSTDYRVLGGIDEARSAAASSGGWLAARTVLRQERAYRRADRGHEARRTAARFHASQRKPSRRPGSSNPRLLEIGCGSGYYSEVFADVASRRRRLHRHRLFRRHDRPRARTLSVDRLRGRRRDQAALRRQAFDIVFNGVSLMHIIDYPAAIREAARVAGRYCIFHSVPVFDDHRTTYLTEICLWRAGRRGHVRQAGTDVAVPATPDCAWCANGPAFPMTSTT